MTAVSGPLVSLGGRLTEPHAARATVERLGAEGVIYAELRFCPFGQGTSAASVDATMAEVHAGLDIAAESGCESRLIVEAGVDAAATEAVRVALDWMTQRVVGVGVVGEASADAVAASHVAADAGLSLTVAPGAAGGIAELRDVLDHLAPDRLGAGWGIIEDCVRENGRIVGLGPTAARVRDAGLPLEVAALPDDSLRALFDAGFRPALNPRDLPVPNPQRFTDVEMAACVERSAGAAFLPSPEREDLVERVAAGWAARPARLVHLAERSRWDLGRARGSYLPAEWEADGFIHLSSLHQLLTPANRFYRGRTDLVALVLDAHLLGSAVVWEAGTGTVERFPHLYSAITAEAVLGEVELAPQPDGGFLLPPALMRAVRSPLGR